MLAEANVVAEEVLSTMTTVKAFAAEDAAESSYADRLQKFTHLQLKEAAAYSVYAFTTILMPNSVAVVALFYVCPQPYLPTAAQPLDTALWDCYSLLPIHMMAEMHVISHMSSVPTCIVVLCKAVQSMTEHDCTSTLTTPVLCPVMCPAGRDTGVAAPHEPRLLD